MEEDLKLLREAADMAQFAELPSTIKEALFRVIAPRTKMTDERAVEIIKAACEYLDTLPEDLPEFVVTGAAVRWILCEAAK
jgi:hypothetical protein